MSRKSSRGQKQINDSQDTDAINTTMHQDIASRGSDQDIVIPDDSSPAVILDILLSIFLGIYIDENLKWN